MADLVSTGETETPEDVDSRLTPDALVGLDEAAHADHPPW